MAALYLLFILGITGIVGKLQFPRDAVRCADQSYCPDSTTCCQLNDGSYGCCPINDAVCCADHIHCCPARTTCNVEEGRCERGSLHLPIHKKQAAMRKENLGDIVCPDRRSKCPSGTTCCQMSMSSYGCCPLPNAVCCADRMHCCPSGYTCDRSSQRCLNEETNRAMRWLSKFPATPIRRKEGIEFSIDGEEEKTDDLSADSIEEEKDEKLKICGKVRCPSWATCCASSTDPFGMNTFRCCPLSEAVCCDGYCCPFGYECTERRTCEKKARFFFNTKG